MTLVVDASSVLSWIFLRTDPSEAAEATALFDRLQTEDAQVPELWHLEVTNALLVGVRRSVITPSKAMDFLGRLDGLPIQTATASNIEHKGSLLELARAYDLSVYDAVYLNLALKTGAALATFDRRLATARDRAGVPKP